MGSSSSMRAEETLRSVVIGVFNDFLDGDMELVHTLLREYFWTVFRQGTMPDTSYFLPDRCDERYQSIVTTRGRRHRVCSSHAPSHPRTSPECALSSLCLSPSLTTVNLIAAACRVFTHTLLGTLSHLLETHISSHPAHQIIISSSRSTSHNNPLVSPERLGVLSRHGARSQSSHS